jgi:hypothetical protein
MDVDQCDGLPDCHLQFPGPPRAEAADEVEAGDEVPRLALILMVLWWAIFVLVLLEYFRLQRPARFPIAERPPARREAGRGAAGRRLLRSGREY